MRVTRVSLDEGKHRHVSWEEVPYDCRMKILMFLRPYELYWNYALVSKRCFEDSRATMLPQLEWGEVFCGRDAVHFLRRMSSESVKNAFREKKRKTLKLLGHENLILADGTCDSPEEIELLARRALLPNVTLLDLSIDAEINKYEGYMQQSKKSPYLTRCVPWALARMLPSLQKLNLSYLTAGRRESQDTESELCFFDFDHCPNLQSVTWTNRVGGCLFLRGNDLKTLRNLKELILDNLLADSSYDGYFSENSFNFLTECCNLEFGRCLFFRCNLANLEHVSLLGMKFVHQSETCSSVISLLPQTALMKLVRHMPMLKWFRSDLAGRCLEIIQSERPDVIFTNH